MDGPTKQALERLAAAVEARRDDLDLNQDQLPHGPSTTTMTRIENAKPVSALSYKKLEQSLEWQRHSVAAIFRGEDPTPMPAALVPGVIAPTVASVDLTLLSDDDLIAEVRRRMRGERHGVADDTKPNASGEARKAEEAASGGPAAGHDVQGWSGSGGNTWSGHPVEPPGVGEDEDGDQAGELGAR